MKLTNKTGLEQPLYDAIANDPYDKGDCEYSISGLTRPPRIGALLRTHYHEIEEDAADRIFSLFGQAIHTILERAERTALAEQRLYMTVEGVRISGKFDRFHVEKGILQDYKITSIYKFLAGALKDDFEPQQNCYIELLRQNGHEINGSQLICILRDWSKRKARKSMDSEYPPYQTQVVDLEIWPREKTQAYITERVKIHEAAKSSLPQCTQEERWGTDNEYAVKKVGGSRAIKVYANKEDAERHAQMLNKAPATSAFVEVRHGEQKRCLDYCPVSKFCEQFKVLEGERYDAN